MIEAEALLSHAQFLRGLLRALVSDEHLADDLLQEVWVKALERPPGRSGSLRAWLARVLRNLAVSEARGCERRRRRERTVHERRRALPSAEEIAAKEALAGRVIEAVFRLEEPYRSAVLHRFYEGLTPRLIARRQGLPVETVRTRLKRALAALRRDLDRGCGGRARSVTALAAIAGLEAGFASSAAGAAAAGTALSTFSLGAFFMSVKSMVLALTAAILLAASSGWLYLELRDEAARSAALRRERDAMNSELAAARDETRRLEDALAQARLREAELAKGLDDARTAAAATPPPPAAEAAVNDAAEIPPPVEREARKLAITRPEEADALAIELMARGDIEGLWLLGAELLKMGEPGYDKLMELISILDKDTKNQKDSPFRLLWDREEIFMGSFLRTLSDNNEDVLRFLVHVDNKSGGVRPRGLLGDFNQLLTQQGGAALVGYYGGDDPELLSSLTGIYRRQLSQEGIEERKMGPAIMGLSQIQTPEAQELLLETLQRANSDFVRKTVIQALAWRRNKTVLPVLQELLPTVRDPELLKVLTAAIRYLESSP